MNTNEVVDRLYNQFNISKNETKDLLDKLLNCWVDQLDEEKSFTIPGLGTFSTRTRSSHTSYTPYYNAYMKIPPKRVARFQPSKDLKNQFEPESSD